MKDWQERVVVEKKKLDKKIGKLEVFLDSERVDDLTGEEAHLLERQLEAMQEYSSILAERIDGF